MISKINFSNIIATFFNLGRVKFAPGTFGSLAGVIIYLIIIFIFSFVTNKIVTIDSFLNLDINNFTTMISMIFFALGIIASSYYIKNQYNQDPKEVVIDEVAGQLLTISLNIYFINYYLDPSFFKQFSIIYIPIAIFITISFISFRLFDILKPWPICFFDQNIKGGLGIMLDDIIAAFMASAFCCSLLMLFINY
jgi:phosphatidylglycerophosphatase A